MEGGYQGTEDKWDWGAWYEIHTSPLKIKKKNYMVILLDAEKIID